MHQRPLGDWKSTKRPARGDAVASVLADYRDAVTRANRVIADYLDLSAPAPCPARRPTAASMRWVSIRMIEETARHAGHADILREQIDGTTGR
ncbi:MAG: DUF664 domain-containing protein [Mycobacterium sp.]